MEIIKTSSRGQIVIPEEIRKKHKIKEGTKLVLFEEGDKLVLEKEVNIEEAMKGIKDQISALVAEKKSIRRSAYLSKIDPEILNLMMASKEVLAKEWNTKEEDEAWKDL